MTSPPKLTSTRAAAAEPSPSEHRRSQWLVGKRVALVGRLGSMNRREAHTLISRLGGTVVRLDAAHIDLFVLGADASPLDAVDSIPPAWQDAVAAGQLPVVSETQFWEELGLADPNSDVRSLYTPAMLAELLSVSITTVRGWARRGLITPVREIHRLPYFDFQEVSTARRLAEMLKAGMSSSVIAARLQRLAKLVPGADRPLAQLSVMVEGQDLLLRTGRGLVDSSGQRRFDFSTPPRLDDAEPRDGDAVLPFPGETALARADAWTPGMSAGENLLSRAFALEESGEWDAAIEAYRLDLLTGQPASEIHFALAELLYRRGDLPAARERYYCAIELDQDFVEARANLGCVLAEEGQTELAIAALQGAIDRYPDYADAHYHLARLLDQTRDVTAAEHHWREFARLAPDSPWADEACDRLGLLRT